MGAGRAASHPQSPGAPRHPDPHPPTPPSLPQKRAPHPHLQGELRHKQALLPDPLTPSHYRAPQQLPSAHFSDGETEAREQRVSQDRMNVAVPGWVCSPLPHTPGSSSVAPSVNRARTTQHSRRTLHWALPACVHPAHFPTHLPGRGLSLCHPADREDERRCQGWAPCQPREGSSWCHLAPVVL